MAEPVAVINLILVGRTGNGKSATGNTLLGQKLFESGRQAGGVTMKCQMFRAAIQDGPIINIIDTPGLFDLSMSAEYLSREIISCLTMAKEGIHAVLFVLSMRNRMSQGEESTLNSLQRIFENKILDYLIVVFTGGDCLEDDDLTLDDYLGEGCPEFLTTVVRLSGGRKVVFDNKTTDKDKKAAQLKQLLANVEDVRRQTGGKPYTDKMHRKIKEENNKIREKEKEIESKNHTEAEAAGMIDKLRIHHEETMKKMAQMVENTLTQSAEAHQREINQLKEAIQQQGQQQPFMLPLPQSDPTECNIM